MNKLFETLKNGSRTTKDVLPMDGFWSIFDNKNITSMILHGAHKPHIHKCIMQLAYGRFNSWLRMLQRPQRINSQTLHLWNCGKVEYYMKNAYDNNYIALLYNSLLHFFWILQGGNFCTEEKTKIVYIYYIWNYTDL